MQYLPVWLAHAIVLTRDTSMKKKGGRWSAGDKCWSQVCALPLPLRLNAAVSTAHFFVPIVFTTDVKKKMKGQTLRYIISSHTGTHWTRRTLKTWFHVHSNKPLLLSVQVGTSGIFYSFITLRFALNLHFPTATPTSTMWDGEEGDGYLDLHAARSSCGPCSPCTSRGCGQRREISGSPWPRRRPQPERMRTAASCCSGCHVSPPALCNSQQTTCSPSHQGNGQRRANKT